MAFYVSPTTACGYAVLVAVWIAGTAAARFVTTRAARRGLAFAVAVTVAVVMAWVLATGKGWGGARVTDRFVTRCAPDLSAWLSLAGLIAWRVTRGRSRPYLPVTLALAATGVAVAGARELIGDVGALMLLPCAVVAAGVGAAFLWRNTPLGRTPLGRNLLVVLVIGILMGTAKAGIDRGIRGPSYALDRSEDGPVSRPIVTPEME